MNDYYLYALLDPRKPGLYIYGDYNFKFEPFYVGKGRGKRIKQHYNPVELVRNNLKSTKIKAIRNANLQPIEQYLIKNSTEIDILIKEVELIDIIGRLDKKKGLLTNMTDGGEGVSGYIAPDWLKVVRSKNNSGEKNPMFGKKHIMGVMDFNNRKVYQIDNITGEIMCEFTSLSDAAKKTNSDPTHIGECCRGKRTRHNGFKWQYVSDDDKIIRNWKGGGSKRAIFQLDPETDEVIREWDSISNAARYYKVSKQNIIKVLNGRGRLSGGFKWKYK